MRPSALSSLGRLMPLRRLRKLLIWSGAVFVAVTIFAFVGLPPLMRSFLMRTLSDTLHREVTIQQIKINPLTLSLTIKGVVIKDRETPDTFASFDQLFINLQSFSLLRWAVILKGVRLDRPYIRIVRHHDDSYNFSDLLEADDSGQGGGAAPRRFSLNDIRIVDGGVDFLDQPRQTTHTARDVNISIPFLSNYPYYIERSVEPRVSATINGSQWVLEGKTKPFASSWETAFEIDITDLDIPHYLAYVPTYIPIGTNFRIRSGKLTVKAQLSFVQQPRPALTVEGRVALRQLSVNDAQDQPFLTLPLLDVALAPTEPLAGLFRVASVTLESPELFIRRDPSGVTNIQTFFPGHSNATTDVTAHDTATSTVVDIDTFQLSKGTLSFSDTATAVSLKAEKNTEDQTPAKPTNLIAQDLTVRADNLTTRKGRPGPTVVSFRLNKGGTATVNGPIGLTPLTAQLAVSLKAIDLRPFQPYFTNWVKMYVTKGTASTDGNLSLSHQEGSGLQAAYKGELSVAQFGSVDKAHAQDFLSWQSLAFDNLNVGYNPTYVHIGKVALTDFYARLIVHPDGSVNLAQIMEKETPAPADTSTTAPPPTHDGTSGKAGTDVQVQTVTLQGGRVSFSDTSLKPVYSMELAEIGGRVSGLSSDEATLADVELRGKVNKFAPIEILGKINPLRDDLFVDLKARFRDMDLSTMTPYSGKYIGYTIEKGKLSFDVRYQIAKRKLDAKNNLFLDQITLGEKVDSPTATNLPIRLAIALLKDRNGEIRLDLPVSGSLDDPDFSFWKVVLQILVNLISKAATAPFSLLGALIGGGEELGYLEYDPGSAVVADANAKKIEMLVKALYERPTLKLEIEGHVDVEKDREGLRQRQFMRKLKVQKFNQRLKQGQPSIPVDELNLEPAEYEPYLKLAYKAETFPKPRNPLGFAKDLPVPEMEKLMLAYIQITDDDLRLLASQRVMKVKDAILGSNKIEPERLFIIEPKSLTPEKRGALKQSRVDFRIR